MYSDKSFAHLNAWSATSDSNLLWMWGPWAPIMPLLGGRRLWRAVLWWRYSSCLGAWPKSRCVAWRLVSVQGSNWGVVLTSTNYVPSGCRETLPNPSPNITQHFATIWVQLCNILQRIYNSSGVVESPHRSLSQVSWTLAHKSSWRSSSWWNV